MVHSTGPGQSWAWLCPAEERGEHTLGVHCHSCRVQGTLLHSFSLCVLFRICLTQGQGLCYVLCSPTGSGTEHTCPSLEGRGKGTLAEGSTCRRKHLKKGTLAEGRGKGTLAEGNTRRRELLQKGTLAAGAMQRAAVLVHVWYRTQQVLSCSRTAMARPFPDGTDEFLCTPRILPKF